MVIAAPAGTWNRSSHQRHQHEELVERFVITPIARDEESLRFGVMLDGAACSSLLRIQDGMCKDGFPRYRWICDSCQHSARTKSQQYRHLIREHLSCVQLSLEASVRELMGEFQDTLSIQVREVDIALTRKRHVALAGREPIGTVYYFQHPTQSYWRCDTCRLICVEKWEMTAHLRSHTNLLWPIELVFDKPRPASQVLVPFTPEQMPVKREQGKDDPIPSSHIELLQTRVRYLVLAGDTLLGSLHLVTNGPSSTWQCACGGCQATYTTPAAIVAHLQYAHQTVPHLLLLYPCFTC